MFTIDLDLSEILNLDVKIKEAADKALTAAAQSLALATHGHLLENVREKLHSTRQKYLDAVGFKQISKDAWLISLDPSANWIEDGMQSHEMIDSLLSQGRPRGDGKPAAQPAKTAADGCVLNPRNRVLTSLGWKKIKDIVPGDIVLTHSGKFREVKELLVTPAGVGTKYVCFYPNSTDKRTRRTSKENSDLTCPSISLTEDHPVLTPNGWVPAKELCRGSLVATPADLKRLCLTCGAPLPINTPKVEFCLNHRCAVIAAVKAGRLLSIGPVERRINSKMGNQKARDIGVFDRPDWGARNPAVLKKMRDGSAAAMRSLASTGKWKPEVFFEKNLDDAGVIFERERPILTDRTVNAGAGRTRKSTMYFDFYIPELKLAIELDGVAWHSGIESQERDKAKDEACKRDGIRMLRIPSHKIYRRGPRLAKHLKIWTKNHSGELGIAWVKIWRIKKGIVTRPDHVYAKKYDICLDAEEHSFCCQTVFIHNSKYRVIPFEHNKGPKAQTQKQTSLTDILKSTMKQLKIPYGKIEKDANGKAKVGLLHSFDIIRKPGGGAVEVGKHSGISLLQGVRVYQKPVMSKSGVESIKKSVMTFRIVSSKHKGTGRWQHPGLAARDFFPEAYLWAMDQWKNKIAPEILAQFQI